MLTAPSQRFEQAIQNALKLEIARITNEEAKFAAQRVEERVRELAAKVASRVCSRMRYTEDSFGRELVIHVEFPNTNQTQP